MIVALVAVLLAGTASATVIGGAYGNWDVFSESLATLLLVSNAIPLPAAMWLIGSAVGLALAMRKRRANDTF